MADIRLHPAPPPDRDPGEGGERSARSDPELLAQGWTRRNLADPARVREIVDLYRSLGYEVKAVEPRPEDVVPPRSGCAPAVCGPSVMIYTRKTGAPTKEHPMEATRCLREEHQVILRVLACFEIALREAEAANAIDRPTFERFVEFFRGFADHCHHCKEEDRLFPVLVSAGVPKEGGPIGCMLAEHVQARELVREMGEHLEAAGRGDAGAVRSILDGGASYLDLLRNHIAKEDHVLFNMADGILGESAVAGLATAYAEAEAKPEYCERFTRCRALADELTGRYGLAAP